MFNFKSGDINILVSMVNMKLRDEYSSLYDFISNYDVSIEELTNRMESNGYYYNEEENQFKRK